VEQAGLRNWFVRNEGEPEGKVTLMALPVIAITNESTVLADDEVKAVLPALQRQCDIDFCGFWHMTCKLEFIDRNSMIASDPSLSPGLLAGWWQIVVVDDPTRPERWAITR
jgi:hypothetical protein